MFLRTAPGRPADLSDEEFILIKKSLELKSKLSRRRKKGYAVRPVEAKISRRRTGELMFIGFADWYQVTILVDCGKLKL